MNQDYTDNNANNHFEYDEVSEISTISQNGSKKMSQWTRKEKILVSSFMIIGVGVLLLGFLQFYSRKTITVYDVFGQPNKSGSSETAALAPLLGSGTNSSQDSLKLLDTDGDGLTDYDEINTYGTSPYLEDSDSDGTLDKEEIDKGDNPNCPKGQTCGFAVTTNNEAGLNTSSTDTNQLLNNALLPDTFGGLTGLEQGLLDGSLDAASLRSLLEQNGAGQDLLNQISDEDLEGLYKSTLGRAEDGGLLDNGNNSLQSLGDIQNLSVDQIRQMMVEGGLSAEEVANLSDDEVQTIFQQTLDSLGGQN